MHRSFLFRILWFFCFWIFINNVVFAADPIVQIWNYYGRSGPQHWAKLDPDYRLCSMGKQQSPINIPRIVANKPNHLEFHYTAMPLQLRFGIRNLYIVGDAAQEYVIFNGEKYQLQQVHFHTHSEHTLYGQHYPMEAHLVHKNLQGETLVVSVFIKHGDDNNFLQHVFSVRLPQRNHEATYPAVTLNPLWLIPQGSSYYTYSGSLTTPPCTEGVAWIIMKTAVRASAAQMQEFKNKVILFNARPLQPLNGRVISS
jgi:carbonic anhydrase